MQVSFRGGSGIGERRNPARARHSLEQDILALAIELG
jgi:hypothetical protein